ncbi:MAG: hemopexin repeat-containing protein [bacterium]
MSDIGCSIKSLPDSAVEEATHKAIEVNPANAPPPQLNALAGGVLPPQKLVAMTKKYWGAKGVRLRVGFLDNPAADLRARILSHMNAWGSYSNVQFIASSVDPQVRITRTAGGGHWSYLGTDVLSIAAGDATMNLDGFTMSTADSEFYRVVRHETGHTLGFPHEHMRQEIVARIDKEKAIKYFATQFGWSKQDTIEQVLTPLANSALLAIAQPDIYSIMCYVLPASIMKDGVAVTGGTDIDAQDAAFVAQIYPGAVSPSSIHPHNPKLGTTPGGKAYFFKAAQYERYDPKADKVDPGYPKAIAGHWPGFPASFASGVSAAVVWGNGKIYFFKGDKYIRYDIAADKVDAGYPKPIAGNWPGLFADSIDAAVVWPTGKAYFFKGSQYVRYDVAKDKADPGYPRPIKGNWHGFPTNFTTGIDTVVVWNNGKAYFFKGSEYLRYDIASDKVDAGYPKTIKGRWSGLFDKDIAA